MKIVKYKIIIILVLFYLFYFSYSSSYLFGLKSWDNTIDNIIRIEDEYGMRFSIVSFIFDPWSVDVENTLSNLNIKLGEDRIYHISISPNNFSAKEVMNGAFDDQYKSFFSLVKRYDLKVIFRTMHEMNGGRYPRSSDPYHFKKAWMHVRELSREIGLDTNNILFDMSLNARDLPAKNGKTGQRSIFIQCQQNEKKKSGCPTFENYYPGDGYVDLLGVTFYNRGKGNSNRQWLNPKEIINAKGRNTLDRMKRIGKPIFIDEVGTTSVNYTGAYNYKKSLDVFANDERMKNQWLLHLRDFFLQEPSIVGANYFNVDLTNGLKQQILGELDWSVIDFRTNKFYKSIVDIYDSAQDLKKNDSVIMNMFDLNLISMNGKRFFVKTIYNKPINDITNMLDCQYFGNQQKIAIVESLYTKGILAIKYRRFNDGQLSELIGFIKKIYTEKEKNKR